MKNKNLTLVALVLMGVLALSACDGPDSARPDASTRLPQIALTTDPDPPTAGPVRLIAEAKDEQGQPLSDAQVLILVSHTDMSGMDQQGIAIHAGNGRYVLTVDLSGMSGEWLVTVQVRKGDVNLAQDFRIEAK